MTDIVIAIDGTGASDNDVYEKEMTGGKYKSFTYRIASSAESRGAKVFYQRGPSGSGKESSVYGTLSLMRYVAGLVQADGKDPIRVFITGWSRGAMIATYVANRIAEFNALHGLYSRTTSAMKRSLGFRDAEPVPVSLESVILFDSVECDLTMGGPGIRKLPTSVKAGTHFICNKETTSRWYFNRIVLDNPATQIEVRGYKCTHSCIGGIPGEGDAAPDASAFTNNKPIFSGDMTQKSWGAKMLAETGFHCVRSLPSKVPGVGLLDDKCNVTVREDEQVFKRIESDLKRQLWAQNWPVEI